MDASWKLGKPSLFGSGLFLGEDVVHVLVVLPQIVANAVTSGILNLGIRLTKFWKAFREDYTKFDLVAGIRNLVILGNPGIGKTVFGYFILLHLARSNETVVYEPARGKDRFLFCGETAVAGSNTDFKDILNLSETYYVVDAIAPIHYAAKTILLTSPRPKMSHRVLHIIVEDDFNNEGYVFASRHVLNMVYHKVFAENRGRLLAFLSSCSKIDSFAVVYGLLFETYVHSILPRGGTFRVRRLTEGSKKKAAGGEKGESKITRVITDEDVEEVVLRERKATIFEGNIRVAADDPPTYLRPASGNFESVDAMGTPNELFQMTCAKVHPCKRQGLRRVLDMLGNPAEPRLYFVVPADIFGDFEFQNYQKSGRKKANDILDTDDKMKELKQYVMEIPLVEESKRMRPHEEDCTCHQSKMAKLDIK
uniref:Uncharacterized protein n=1 Tax=Hyaloperonospora arabidopsidis (strain Emoy2) TaxID=559515 RepID=M4B8L9_HYAAE